MAGDPDGVRFGIEHELAFLRADGAFADFTNTTFTELQDIVDALPADPADYPDLRVGDQGIKHKRWYVEGFERFDEAGGLVRCDPKGIEVRTRIHPSVEDAVAALERDVAVLEVEALSRGMVPFAIGFNPVRSAYPIVPELNEWERVHRTGSPEERTAHLHMVTHGPDLNLSFPGLGPAELVDAAAKLTHYSPFLVPLSFSSPFRDGRPWGGLSARTAIRTGVRPAALVFLAGDEGQVVSDPSLTQVARLPAEIGRIEFKAFDACPDPALYGELFSLLTGLLLDDTLPGRRTVPDAAVHRQVAMAGLADPEVHARTGELIGVAERALAHRPEDLDRLVGLRKRWAAKESPASAMLARYAAGDTALRLAPSA
ncbi:MAG: glutamate-cysteine ligase family protein [Pseudonocardia sp.]|nr:glutamate-cysteine ligase family protein [Pseudonocardia sp.]